MPHMLLRNLYLVQKKIDKREKNSDAKYLEEKKMQDQIESSERKRLVHLPRLTARRLCQINSMSIWIFAKSVWSNL